MYNSLLVFSVVFILTAVIVSFILAKKKSLENRLPFVLTVSFTITLFAFVLHIVTNYY